MVSSKLSYWLFFVFIYLCKFMFLNLMSLLPSNEMDGWGWGGGIGTNDCTQKLI